MLIFEKFLEKMFLPSDKCDKFPDFQATIALVWQRKLSGRFDFFPRIKSNPRGQQEVKWSMSTSDWNYIRIVQDFLESVAFEQKNMREIEK